MIKMSLTDVKISEKGLYSVLHSQRGPVARYLRHLGVQTVLISKTLAGVRTGRLKRSIAMKTERNRLGYAVVVGSDVRHALTHHEGSRAHGIAPRQPGGVLVFRGRRGTVFTTHVNHPGTQGNPYLTAALAAAIRRPYSPR